MTTPTLQGVCDSVKKLPFIDRVPSYVPVFQHPGGCDDLYAGVGFLKAKAFLLNEKEISANKLVMVNGAITEFMRPLKTHHEDWKEGLRIPSETYLYPNCPRGYPVKQLHKYIFVGKAEKLDFYDALLKKPEESETSKTPDSQPKVKRWFDLVSGGHIPTEDMKLMFKTVSSTTHGTPQDFLDAWTDFHKKNPFESTQLHPVEYAVRAHDLIIQYMPFVRANRMTARLILCHYLSASQIPAPIFYSRPGYEAHVCKFTSKQFKEMEKKPGSLSELIAERSQFTKYIVTLVHEATNLITKEEDVARPFDLWEKLILENRDPKGSLFAYIKKHKRVLFSDIISAFSIFFDTKGGAVLFYEQEKKSWFYSGLSSGLARAIGELVNESKIGFVPTSHKEYENYEQLPPFDKNKFPAEGWMPCALMAIA